MTLQQLQRRLVVTLLRIFTAAVSFFSRRAERRFARSSGIVPHRIRIPTRDPGRFLAADLYVPKTPPSQPPPVVVNWHPSGWVLPNLGIDCLFCVLASTAAGAYVLDVDYRKAPETPFPGAVHDVEDALRWVAAQRDMFDTTKVVVSGFSAGANLALVAATTVRKMLAGTLAIPIVIAFYPITDFTLTPEERAVPNPIRPTPPALAKLFHDCYLPDETQKADVRASPGRADAEDFPETVVMVTCEGDPLCREGMELAERLKTGQRRVESVTLGGVGHAFDKGATRGTIEWKRRDEAYLLAAEVLRDAFIIPEEPIDFSTAWRYI
ncbi:hypothetical protein S7711_08639 [Stachybotrys chartarum IBT 7711]|uniref:Alpha/beta hydrolase fold-3 domain-containing protein n=1 Tax=Stachybotrys chartarum (strain CBS 109288 / IBT 7711) TaxID=1280523 RepID=A0A084AXT0_STACB|nr:hypothetical protein S7711_08639 [Stachybotrys chartarum IBT 7711]KFA50607.1 hypothetical protein S40293_08393 [Stachybotrys chartarum IBT 40293]KFA70795.1 hypothetical protein S40288_09627 [Stachybotrys chartarum IBT 40288]